MTRRYRIGSVPYLNGMPLTDYLETPECASSVDLSFAVPSDLAKQLRAGKLDVAMVSIFEGLREPGLTVVPGVSVSANGPVKSVRLFSRVPFAQIRTVALDTSSLTSTALTRILLSELYHIEPKPVRMAPDLGAMLQACDAGLIIGPLDDFDVLAPYVLDLGAGWFELTGLPFVYAGWLAREEVDSAELTELLLSARDYGCGRLEDLSVKWADRMALPLPRVRDYFSNVMRYGLDELRWKAIRMYQRKCFEHGLLDSVIDIRAGAEAPASSRRRMP